MAGTLTISTLSDGTNSTSATNCIQGSAKAWVKFGVSGGVVTVNNSYNVSSVTRTGTGHFTLTFTNALANTNYVPVASTSAGAYWPSNYWATSSAGTGLPTFTTTNCYLNTGSHGGGDYDPPYCGVIVVGN